MPRKAETDPGAVSPLRRTAVLVSDLERSLRFYRDLLGIEVFYDQEIRAEASGKQFGPLRREERGGDR
jgi:catechol 2,3-dioxygenase-like lactoylglutathione lyase family enzyme